MIRPRYRKLLSRRAFLRTASLGGLSLATASLLRHDLLAETAGSQRAAAALQKLHKEIDGELILPAHAEYGRLRRPASFNPQTDKHPAAIVRCASAKDVRHAILSARELDLPLAVRGGGHDVMGQSTCEGGLVLDLSPLRQMKVQAEKQRLRAGAGLRAGEVTAGLAPHRLAAVLGCNPVVGIAGLTLGGGLGWLLGRHGATCDNLLGAEVVTAEGEVLEVSTQHHPDLFWALRGGGGNFGVVTRFDYRVHPVAQVVGGYMAFTADRVQEFFHFFGRYMANAPRELVAETALFARDRPYILVILCYSGAEESAENVLQPLRSFAKPVFDTLRKVPYAQLTDPPAEVLELMSAPEAGAGIEGERPEPAVEGGFNYWYGVELPSLSDGAIQSFSERLGEAPPGWSAGIGHYLHGQICESDPKASALPRRPGSWACYFNSSWGEPEHAEVTLPWVDDSVSAMQPHASQATYINYLSRNDEASVRASYGDRYDRLARLKAQYDPDNVFALNRNIRPAVRKAGPKPAAGKSG